MAAVIVKLECITNMHVGNGEVNYNIIDNEVERDPVTNYPTINASGVKGALREYFAIHKPELVDEAFGKDGKESTPGKLKVLGADMLYMPLRASLGKEPYYLVTTDEILERFALFNKTFLRKDVTYTSKEENGAAAEGISLKKYVMLDEKKVYIVGDDELRHISLPVLARNKLDNGRSTNLWYEEVVPHESVFSFVVLSDNEELLKSFADVIRGRVVQFGGNASIGYGLCKVSISEA
ncbi:MAG: CRISPR-associated protein Cmr4 [Clostridia bacterium]|nr:CRISPR-associated protein Cmr4 [Clostridia bacterium]